MVSNEVVTEEEVTELMEDTVETVAEEPESATPDGDYGEIDSTSIIALSPIFITVPFP